MKEHIQRELVNDLRAMAVEYHAHQCLRELISTRVTKALEDERAWHTSGRDQRRKLVESNMTKGGGFTLDFLASIGVSWPPPAGWKDKFIKEGPINAG